MNANDAKKILFTALKEIDPEINLDTLKVNEPLKKQIKFDSLDFLDLSIILKRKHGIHIVQTDYPKLKTLEDWCQYLSQASSLSFLKDNAPAKT